MASRCLQSETLEALLTPDPQEKILRVRRLRKVFLAGGLPCLHPEPMQQIEVPGRPARPLLVVPAQLERRGLGSRRGRAALIHAVAHIEFNAINLALDAAYRYPGMPTDYYADWLRVADDEARHFELLADRLTSLDAAYGDFPAHNGLWEMALKTAHCGMSRMALVPRVLEARGLDVSPGMIQRLRQVGDQQSAEILELILREEVAHVEIGSRWFRHWCGLRDVEPVATFRALLDEHAADVIRGPFNEPARRRAGFGSEELDLLHELDRRRGARH